MFTIALRNIVRNSRRVMLLAVILSLAFAVSFLSNNILESIEAGFGTGYTETIVSDAVIFPATETEFSLFGAELLLVGDYLVPPVLEDSWSVFRTLDETPGVLDYTAQITSIAQVKSPGASQNLVLFGVDFEDYFEMFPAIAPAQHMLPDEDGHGIYLQPSTALALSPDGVRPLEPGDDVLVTSTTGNDFTIRELPVLGIVAYPRQDELIARLALIDHNTARSLNGYFDQTEWNTDLSDDQEFLADASMDDLLSAPARPEQTDPTTGDEPDSSNVLDSILTASTDQSGSSPASDEPASEAPATSDEGFTASDSEWNFVIIKGTPGVGERSVVAAVEESLENDSYIVKDWKSAVGGNVTLIGFIRSAINIGFFVVIAGVLAVTMNSIMLSILERRAELGTMRAIGATKGHLVLMVALEVALIISAALIVGLVSGAVLTAVINGLRIQLNNPLVRELFGSDHISANMSYDGVAYQLGIGLIVYVAALYVPLRKVLSITPLKAIS